MTFNKVTLVGTNPTKHGYNFYFKCLTNRFDRNLRIAKEGVVFCQLEIIHWSKGSLFLV